MIGYLMMDHMIISCFLSSKISKHHSFWKELHHLNDNETATTLVTWWRFEQKLQVGTSRVGGCHNKGETSNIFKWNSIIQF